MEVDKEVLNDTDAWDSVLKEDSGIDPVKEAKQAAEAVAEADLQEEEVVVVETPVEALPIKDPLAEMKELIAAQSKQLRDLNGKFGGLSEQMKQVAQEATVAKAAAAPEAQAAIKEAQKTPEKWEAFKKEWEGSGFVESIEEYVASQVGTKQEPANVQELLAQARQDLQQQFSQETTALRQQVIDLTVAQVHPGWRETVKTKEFNDWRAAQPADVQQLAFSDKPEDAIQMLSLHKQSTAPAADKAKANRERLENAVNPTRPAPARKTLSLDDMTPEQIWAYENRKHEVREKQTS